MLSWPGTWFPHGGFQKYKRESSDIWFLYILNPKMATIALAKANRLQRCILHNDGDTANLPPLPPARTWMSNSDRENEEMRILWKHSLQTKCWLQSPHSCGMVLSIQNAGESIISWKFCEDNIRCIKSKGDHFWHSKWSMIVFSIVFKMHFYFYII